MKLLFILFVPFLVSIDSISNEKSDRVKCCDFSVENREKYVTKEYKFVKSMKINMAMAHKERNKVEYTLVADKDDAIKYITQVQYEKIDNLDIILLNSRRVPVSCEKRNLDSKRIEMKVTIPERGIYYLSFIRKDTLNREPICAAALMFKKQNTPSKKQPQQDIKENQIYKK